MANEPKTPTPQWRRFARLNTNSKHLRKRARKIESATLRHAHRFIIRRWENARDVRRHIIGWLVLVTLLIGATLMQGVWYLSSYTSEAPAIGATYAEGVVGKLDTMNPLFAATPSERAGSRLIFSSLLEYDRKNHLKGDLAATWLPGKDGDSYKVTLKPDLKWHDGAPLTADDIVFTVGLMKNPVVRADPALFQTWTQIEVRKINDQTVEFLLPGKFPPFLHALTFGVVPKHILENVEPERIRESDFGRQPIGSGPFVFQNIQVINPDADRVVLQLKANNNYHLGAPRLNRFQLHTYGDDTQLQKGFLSGEINASVGLPVSNIEAITDARPTAVVSKAGLYNGMFTLFNTSKPLLKDVNMRRALAQAVDRDAIIERLKGNALPMNGPLLSSQYASNGAIRQVKTDKRAADAALDKAGWRRGGDDIRRKGQQTLQLSLLAPRSGDYALVVEQVSKDLREIGVDIRTELVNPDTFAQNILRPRAYDILIYELAIGVDPDSYAYWHSSQAGTTGRTLNLSNYESTIADEALQSARTAAQPKLRAAKYQSFVEQWLKDVPAIALYQPTIHYISTPTTLTIPTQGNFPDSINRYRSVEYWAVGKELVFTTP